MDLEPPDFDRLRLGFRDAARGDRTRALERAHARGLLERLRPGVFRPVPPPLAGLDRSERHEESRRRFLDHVVAVGLTRRAEPAVFSHGTALAILGLPTVGRRPGRVDLLEPKDSARRSALGVRVHRLDSRPDEVVPWGPFFVTTPARTLADVARSGDFMATVVALDAALSIDAAPLLRLAKSDVAGILARHGDWGLVRAEAALAFADGRAANGGESASRVVIHELGFEVPDLQVRHHHPHGFYDADFEWPRRPDRPRPLIGEFDGVGKYLKTEYLGAHTPGDAVVLEKRREDTLRRQGNDFVRWGWPEVRRRAELDRMLREAGLRPTRRPVR